MSVAHWLAFRSAPGLGMGSARRLLARYGTLEAAFTDTDTRARPPSRVNPDALEAWRRVDLAALEARIAEWESQGITLLTPEHPAYPPSLLDLPQAPTSLTMRGDIMACDSRRVALVGTREPSAAGFTLAYGLARDLAARGFCIVSGLAVGIDTAAHAGALAAPGGRTLAVLGSGVLTIHPRGNRSLADEVSRRGALLSEYAPEQTVDAGRLLARDRILAALGDVVVVIEARARSGSIVTAAHGRRLQRPVLALPGTPGCDALLDQGALALPKGPDAADCIAEAAQTPPLPAPEAQPTLF